MQTRWIEKNFCYDGSQLRSLFAYLNFGILGDSIVAWRGACEVSSRHMIDGEDLLANAEIRGADMVHFIIEKFDCKLFTAVALQRLLASIVKDLVAEIGAMNSSKKLIRDGDDIYWERNKLSISIATVSPVSSLIHFAVNVTNENTPVATASLGDFSIKPEAFAKEVMLRFAAEAQSITVATQKVRPAP